MAWSKKAWDEKRQIEDAIEEYEAHAADDALGFDATVGYEPKRPDDYPDLMPLWKDLAKFVSGTEVKIRDHKPISLEDTYKDFWGILQNTDAAFKNAVNNTLDFGKIKLLFTYQEHQFTSLRAAKEHSEVNPNDQANVQLGQKIDAMLDIYNKITEGKIKFKDAAAKYRKQEEGKREIEVHPKGYFEALPMINLWLTFCEKIKKVEGDLLNAEKELFAGYLKTLTQLINAPAPVAKGGGCCVIA